MFLTVCWLAIDAASIWDWGNFSDLESQSTAGWLNYYCDYNEKQLTSMLHETLIRSNVRCAGTSALHVTLSFTSITFNGFTQLHLTNTAVQTVQASSIPYNAQVRCEWFHRLAIMRYDKSALGTPPGTSGTAPFVSTVCRHHSSYRKYARDKMSRHTHAGNTHMCSPFIEHPLTLSRECLMWL